MNISCLSPTKFALAARGWAVVLGLLLAVLAPLGAAAAGEWLPGDMHSHISPPDVPPNYNHAKNNLEGAIAAAKDGKLKWLVITPHAMDLKDEKSDKLWAVEMNERLAKRQAQPGDPLVVLGWECTLAWPGHMTVSFVDLTKVVGKSVPTILEEVRKEGGLVIVAHPFDLPNILDKGNRSWRPWTAGPRGQELDPWLSGLEVRHPLSPAVLATEQWDNWIAREKRRIVGVGATDDHWGTLYPTTWVNIDGKLTKEKLHEALKNGRIVVGSDASASSLTVTSDRHGPKDLAPSGGPGEAIGADTEVQVSWSGSGGRLFIDGTLQAQAQSPFPHKFAKNTFHWYRLEMGIKSYSNPVYVNLPPEKEPAPVKAAEKNLPAATRDVESEKVPPPRK